MPDWRKTIQERLARAKLDPVSETEVIEELAQHMDDRYEELRACGIPEEECCRRVLAELDRGDPLVRAARLIHRSPGRALALGIATYGKGHMHGITNDLKIAFRHIRTQPLFSLMVIGMLALGIAGNAAIFSIFNGLFLRSLPFVESDRLVELDETAPKWSLRYVGVSNPDFYQWRKSNSTFADMAFFTGASYNLSDGNTVERVNGAQVTREMLDVLRLKPLVGRDFQSEEDKPGGAKVVLLSYDLWQRMFRGDHNVLGRILRLDEQPYTVIGVLSPGAVFPDRVDLWTPLAADTNRTILDCLPARRISLRQHLPEVRRSECRNLVVLSRAGEGSVAPFKFIDHMALVAGIICSHQYQMLRCSTPSLRSSFASFGLAYLASGVMP